jgi:hypothetical protein
MDQVLRKAAIFLLLRGAKEEAVIADMARHGDAGVAAEAAHDIDLWYQRATAARLELRATARQRRTLAELTDRQVTSDDPEVHMAYVLALQEAGVSAEVAILLVELVFAE